MLRLRAAVLFICLAAGSALAEENLILSVHPDREDHLYGLGDTVAFLVTGAAEGRCEDCVPVSYRITEDGARLLAEGSFKLEDGGAQLEGTLDKPGFLRCDLTWIDGPDTVKAVCACGFSVESIRPTGIMPHDFSRFWREAAAELVRIPIDPRLEQVEDEDLPEGARRYRVSLATVKSGRVHGWLSFPPGQGPFPTVLVVPGAGVGKTWRGTSYIKAGLAVLSINVHGIEPDREDKYYQHLKSEQVGLGWEYLWFGLEDPYHYYFRRVIQDCIRALDYLHTRQDVDTTGLGMYGSSQGGYLSLMVASIDKRVKALVANVPGLCDHTGMLYGRASGGPQLLDGNLNERAVRTLSYYDAALAAGLIEVPAMIGVGFIDAVCPPTSVYAAYNNLKGEKAIENFLTIGHGAPKDWGKLTRAWLLERLNGRGAE